jgi:hypothetical protein
MIHSRKGFGPLFLTRLAYGDSTIDIKRVQTAGPVAAVVPNYDHVFYYEDGSLREQPKPPPIHVQFLPARARAGESYTVVIPDRATQIVDVAVRLVHGITSERAVVREWCQLNSVGRATLAVPPGLAPQSIYVAYLRTQDGTWMPAEGLLEVTH